MRLLFFLPLFWLAGCVATPQPQERATPAAEAPRQQPAAMNKADERPVIVAFGDSLTAGYGVEPGKSYPDYLQKMLDDKGYHYRVVNEGVSGNTTTDGLSRVSDVIADKPQIAILELGGNDGLRGVPVSSMRANLEQIIQQLQQAGIKVVLVGMTLPPNFGPAYIKPFEQSYVQLAKQYRVPRVRFLLEGVLSAPNMMQQDGIHATPLGNQLAARNVMAVLEPLLSK